MDYLLGFFIGVSAGLTVVVGLYAVVLINDYRERHWWDREERERQKTPKRS